MCTAIAPQQLDTLNEVKVDHNNIKDLVLRYKKEQTTARTAKPPQQSTPLLSQLMNTIIREIAVHSEAEEATVYNSLEKLSAEDSKTMRDEHQKLEEELYSLDYSKIDVQDGEFNKKFDHAVKMFLEHSDEEETHPGTLAKLVKSLSPEENDSLARKFIAARKVVPTRPHPSAPQSGGIVHKTLGALTKPHDKIIEMLTGREFVEEDTFRWHHPSPSQVESVKFERGILEV